MDTAPAPVGLSQLAGSTFTAAGVTYRLAPLTVAALAEVEAWVMARLPDPVAIARDLARDLPADLAREILLEAYNDVKNGARRLGSPEATKALVTFEGFRELLYHHGREHQPRMTREDWEAVLAAALADDAAALADRLAESNGGAIPDPKVPSSSATTAAPPTGATSIPG